MRTARDISRHAAAVLGLAVLAAAAPASAANVARGPLLFAQAEATPVVDATPTPAPVETATPAPTPVPAETATPAPLATAAPAATPVPAATPEPPPRFQEKPKYLPPLFIVDHDEVRQSDFFMLLMLYWSDSNPDRSYHLLIPFFYERHNKHSQGTAVAGPFFYYYKSPSSKALYVPPVYVERGREVSRTGIPPLFWYGRLGAKGDAHAETTSYLFPLYFYDERAGHRVLATPIGGGWGTRNDFQGLVGLYYWRDTHLSAQESGDGHRVDLDAHVLFPIFWHVRDGNTNSIVAGPFFSSTEKFPDGSAATVRGAVPFFYYRKAPGGGKTLVTPLSVFERRDAQTSFLVTPLGGYSKRPGSQTTLIGPWLDQRYPDHRLRAFLPVYFHANGTETEGRDTYDWTLLGLYFQRERVYDVDSPHPEREFDRGLFPLFWYSRDDHRVSFVSPGVIFRKSADGSFRGLFGPFYRSYGHGRETWVLLPGVWHHSGPRVAQSFGFLPFYYVHWKPTKDFTYDAKGQVAKERETPGATAAGLVPVFFYSNKIQSWDGKRARVVTLLPLFWFSEGTGKLTFLSPLYVQIRRPNDVHTMAAWLWWDHQTDVSRNLTLLPVFHWERFEDQRELITPVGGYQKTKDSFAALWGPYYRKRDDVLHTSATVVFPLWWDFRSPEGRTFVVPPYFQFKEGAYFSEGIVPFWFHNSYPGTATTVVLPLFMARFDKVERTHAVLTPLGGLWWREDPRAWKLLAPFVYREEGPSKHTTVIFPLFWYDYDHGRQTVCVPPFYTHSDKDQHSNTTTLIPVFFWHREPGSALLLLLPGVIHAETEAHKNTIVIPLAYWWSRDPAHSAGVAGPWWWSKSRRTGDDRGWHALVPLFFQSHDGDRNFLLTPVAFRWADRNSAIYGFPGFGWATRRDPTSREIVGWNVLAGPLYVRHAPAAADVVLFPLFWHTHDERHARTALIPVFDYERRGNAWRFITLGGGGGSDPDGHGDWWWVLNTFSVRHDDERTSAFLPLAYVKQSPRELQIISPLFFHSEDKVRHSTSTLAPFFFRKTSPQRDTWVAFPLAWWDNDKERGIGVGGVLPVALWMRSKDRDWTAILPLLTYRERRGNDHVYVTGPYVDVSIEGRRSLGVFPIFRYHREDGYSSFVSLPFIFWLKRDGYTRAFVGLGYWNQETGTRVFFPGYVRFQEHDDQHRVTRSVDVAVPGYVHYQTPKKDVKVIGPWYRVKRSDGSSVVGVAIFWYATKRPPDESTWSILGDLVGYQRQGDYSRMTFLWGFHTQPKLVKKKDSSAKPRRFAEEALLEPGC